MGAGKILCIIGGIITLLACYLFSFGDFPSFTIYFYGIALFMNLQAIFTSGIVLAIVFAILGIIFMISGLFIILGVKSRAIAIIGSLFSLVYGVMFMLILFLVVPQAADLISVFSGLAPGLVAGFIPVHVTLGGSLAFGVGLGTYFLIAGGVLGLVGGIMGPDGF